MTFYITLIDIKCPSCKVFREKSSTSHSTKRSPSSRPASAWPGCRARSPRVARRASPGDRAHELRACRGRADARVGPRAGRRDPGARPAGRRAAPHGSRSRLRGARRGLRGDPRRSPGSRRRKPRPRRRRAAGPDSRSEAAGGCRGARARVGARAGAGAGRAAARTPRFRTASLGPFGHGTLRRASRFRFARLDGAPDLACS